MTSRIGFCVSAGWTPRDQEPADLAPRFIEMIKRLKAIDPMFARWRVKPRRKAVRPLILVLDDVVKLIEECVGTDDDGNPEPLYGYHIEAMNGWNDVAGPRDFNLSVNADTNWKHAQNSVSLATAYGVVPDPAAVAFHVLRDALLALSEPFGVSSADAWPSTLIDFWKRGRDMPRLQVSWMSYVGPRYSHLITPPTSAIVERRPDGGLLMSATDATFSVDNPAHMAVAREIEAAVAPFNALPRPLEDVEAPSESRHSAGDARRSLR